MKNFMPRFLVGSLLFLFFSTNIFAQIPSQNVTLLGQLEYPDQDLNDIWGYVDEDTDTEYAIVGCQYGISVVNLQDPSAPVEVGYVPGPSTVWRDMKVWNNYAYCVDDEAGQGLIIIDLNAVPDTITYQVWQGDEETGVNFSTAHNIFIDENGIAYIVGANWGIGGALMLDLNGDPWNPTLVGQYSEHYVHDAYVRGDTLWAAEINDGLLTVIDVSDKSDPIVLGSTATPNDFAHNCWLTDDGKTIYTTDEVNGAYLTAYDVSDVTDIVEVDRIQSSPGNNVCPHNTYVNGDYLVTAYYRDGLTIHDISQPDNMIQVGNFDTSPLSGAGLDGAWGAYCYFPSGRVIVSDMQEGLFIFDVDYQQAAYLTVNVSAFVLDFPIANASVELLGTGLNGFTDFEGVHKTGFPESGTYTVLADAPGFLPKEVEVELTQGETTIADIELNPQVPFNLSGTLIDTDGEPVPNGVVEISNYEFDLATTTDENGVFEFGGFYEGTYEVVAGAWGYTLSVLSEQELASSDGPLNFVLEKGAYLDDFYIDYGWDVANEADLGGWELGEPVGVEFFPFGFLHPDEDIAGDLGDQCYSTGNSGDVFDAVNNGSVRLTSPEFDVTDYESPYLSYHLWFVNASQTGGGNDDVYVQLTNGIDTIELDYLTGLDWSSNFDGWKFSQFDLLDVGLELTPNMRFIVDAQAGFNNFEVLNVGLDAFHVIDSANMVSVQEIQETASTDIQVYPNPTSGPVQLQIDSADPLVAEQEKIIEWYDVTGRRVKQVRFDGNALMLFDSPQAPGMYTYMVRLKDRSVLGSGKIVIH